MCMMPVNSLFVNVGLLPTPAWGLHPKPHDADASSVLRLRRGKRDFSGRGENSQKEATSRVLWEWIGGGISLLSYFVCVFF